MKTTVICIDGVEHTVTPGLIQGHQLFELAGGILAPGQLLIDLDGEIDIPVATGDYLVVRGGEQFVIGDGLPPMDDNPSLRHPIRIKLNGHQTPQEQAFHRPKVNADDIRRLDPNAQPSDGVVLDLRGLADEILPQDGRLIITRHDEFLTVPCGNVGLQTLIEQQLEEVRQHFPHARLEQMSQSGGYLVVPEFPVPRHWDQNSTTLMVMLPNGYPLAALDMFWVSPHLRLRDGREAQAANCFEQHLGGNWQRFSWHYSGSLGWRPGQSSLLSHLRFASTRLQQSM